MKRLWPSLFLLFQLIKIEHGSCAPLIDAFNVIKGGAEGVNAGKNIAKGTQVGHTINSIKDSVAPVTGLAGKTKGANPFKVVPDKNLNPYNPDPQKTLPGLKTQDPPPIHEPNVPPPESHEPTKPPPEKPSTEKPPSDKPPPEKTPPEKPPETVEPAPQTKVTFADPPRVTDDLPPYPKGLPARMREWWRQFTTNQALVFLARYGPENVQEWAKGNKYAQQAVELKDSETWLGYVATKYLKIVPSWRFTYDTTAFGKDGLTGLISKGWNRMWGEGVKGKAVKKKVELAMKILISPVAGPIMLGMLGISKAVDAVRKIYVVKFLNWLKSNSLPHIRATVPNFDLKGEHTNFKYIGNPPTKSGPQGGHPAPPENPPNSHPTGLPPPTTPADPQH